MKYLQNKVHHMTYVLEHTKEITKEGQSPFEMLSQAPWYVRLAAQGQYCVYKDVIYVPSFHLELTMSQNETDRNLATAKLLPCIMFLHDNKHVSFWLMLKFLYALKYQLHYFLYEFLFLKATKSIFYATITMGFMISRKRMFKVLTPDEVEEHLRNILHNSKTL